MDDQFFKRPILNSPYEYPRRHWELDKQGQPTQKIIDARRRADFITPIPKPRKEKKSTTDSYWVPGVNHLGTYGRWAFAEFTDVYEIQDDFEARVEEEFNQMIESIAGEIGT